MEGDFCLAGCDFKLFGRKKHGVASAPCTQSVWCTAVQPYQGTSGNLLQLTRTGNLPCLEKRKTVLHICGIFLFYHSATTTWWVAEMRISFWHLGTLRKMADGMPSFPSSCHDATYLSRTLSSVFRLCSTLFFCCLFLLPFTLLIVLYQSSSYQSMQACQSSIFSYILPLFSLIDWMIVRVFEHALLNALQSQSLATCLTVSSPILPPLLHTLFTQRIRLCITERHTSRES